VIFHQNLMRSKMARVSKRLLDEARELLKTQPASKVIADRPDLITAIDEIAASAISKPPTAEDSPLDVNAVEF